MKTKKVVLCIDLEYEDFLNNKYLLCYEMGDFISKVE